jgi:proteasome assembly chaperone (PAC2) family protein
VFWILVYTCAAAIARIHHTEMPRVWGATNNKDLIDDLKKYDIVLRGNIQIAGLNGLFLGVAKERDIDGICLLGEVPSYTTRIPNPKAALAILGVMAKMLKINVDTAELATIAKQTDEEMKRLAAEAMEEFITSYTKPVWPAPEDYVEEEGEDDDEEEEDDDDEVRNQDN